MKSCKRIEYLFSTQFICQVVMLCILDEYVTDESGEGEDGVSDNDVDDDDDEGWITPGNIEAMKQAAAARNQDEVVSLPVACITTDYAMQVCGHSAGHLSCSTIDVLLEITLTYSIC